MYCTIYGKLLVSENHGPSEIFHQAGRSFVSEVESSVLDPPIGNVVVDHTPVTYQVVEEGTKRRKISLVDSMALPIMSIPKGRMLRTGSALCDQKTTRARRL